ncbi:hypothetical protein [Pseudoduganella violaceinigra]|uniref:hypothetical protein n=1 Tax=Pseudoduganella violaceinigra TaxID=246602 RepID=UPI0012B57173|nr:hypothetical protein [Pseudoduganella violaceinigra]
MEVAAYRPPGWRIAVGILISLLLHVAAVVFLRLPAPHLVADARTWLTEVEVRLVPSPVPPQALAPEPEAVAAAAPRKPLRRVEPRAHPQQAPIELATRPAHESTLVLPPAETGPAAHFDREAAKAAARGIAAELGPAEPGLRASRDEQLGRQIQQAARPHCKDGIPGGLLAPLYLLMDKKDSGCKW